MLPADIAYPLIDPVAFEIGPLPIRWYALAYIVGLIGGWWYARRLVAQDALWGAIARPTPASLDDLLVYVAFGVVLGGRLAYVVFYNPGQFLTHPGEIIAVWKGGMSFHGGLIGAALGAWLFAWRNGLPALPVFDLCSAVVPIGLFLGRIANFIKPELWGRVTDAPWAMVFPDAGPLPRHPSQLYEAGLEGLVLGACRKGQQAYWVCPLIEESETLQLQTATETQAALQAALPELSIGLVHGRMKAAEKAEEMAEHRDLFAAGAEKNGLSRRKADELFDLMEKFAGYGFNKSHAAAYALVAYQTAYMKAHHAAAFMAANMSAVMNDTDKVQQLHDDARANKLDILAPDVNSGGYRFAPVDTKRIRYGLGAIKGTGEGAITHIIEERDKNGPYKDLFDFCHRVDNRIVNRRVVESLVRAGAFDSVDDNRAALLASVGLALESAEQASRNANQTNLFGDVQDHRPTVHLVNISRWNDLERLKQEKTALGFYLSGHPFRYYEAELRGFASTRLDQISPQAQPVMLAGIIVSQRIQMTRRGRMAILALDDSYARIELTVFNELFEQHRHWLKEDTLIVVEGKVTKSMYDESESLRISAEKLFDLQKAREQFARALKITCNGQSSGAKLRALLTPHLKGPCPVAIEYHNQTGRCEISLGEDWKVYPRDELIASLGEWVKPENVRLVYSNGYT